MKNEILKLLGIPIFSILGIAFYSYVGVFDNLNSASVAAGMCCFAMPFGGLQILWMAWLDKRAE